MNYGVILDSLEVGARVVFTRVDMGAATGRGVLVALRRASVAEGPDFFAVKLPGYSMQMGAYSFTREYVPARIKILRVVRRIEPREFEVIELMDVPLRKLADVVHV